MHQLLHIPHLDIDAPLEIESGDYEDLKTPSSPLSPPSTPSSETSGGDDDDVAVGFYGGSFLMLAAAAGDERTIKSLLARGANVNLMTPQDGWTALMAACQNGKIIVVRERQSLFTINRQCHHGVV